MTEQKTDAAHRNTVEQLVRRDPKMRLHTHPKMESNCKVPVGHVIIDQHIFDALFRIHGQYVTPNAPAEPERVSDRLQPDVGHPVGCECDQCYAEARVIDVDTLPVCECEQLDGGLTMGIGDVPHHPKCPMSNANLTGKQKPEKEVTNV